MLSTIFLILSGLFAGMWIRDGSTTILGLGVPWMALLSLALAAAAQPRATDAATRARLEAVYRTWMEAFRQWAPARQRGGEACDRLIAATDGLLLVADYRVVRALRAAMTAGFDATSVATMMLEMRRSLRSGAVLLRATDIQTMVEPAEHRARPGSSATSSGNGAPGGEASERRHASFLG